MKWTAERTKSFLTDAHGRDHVPRPSWPGCQRQVRGAACADAGQYGRLSVDLRAVRADLLYATLLAGVYTTPTIYAEVKAVFTNTVPVDAYRGAGRPEATFLLERLVDVAARGRPGSTGSRSAAATSSRPMPSPTRRRSPCNMTAATTRRRWTGAEDRRLAGFEARRGRGSREGKLRGIGISTYLEACGIAPSAVVGSLGARAGLYEVGTIRVHPTGSVTVLTGTHSHGQGHETTLAQLVADRLGVPMAQVDIVHGDTAKIPFGMGTYGSRSLAVGGRAMVKAMDKIVAKAKKIAAHLMEASVEDVEFERGTFRVAGTDKTKSWGEIALTAYVPHNYPIEELEPGLDETAFYDPKNFTYPGGCHICEVEIDPETGRSQVVNFTAVDDVGRVINPMIVEGQVQGGVAQGIGQALLENAVYDESGQLLSGSLHGLPDAAGGRPAARLGRHPCDALHPQPARGEGLRRGGRHRLAARGDQCGGGCAEGLRRAAHRDAGDAREDLEHHQRRP